MKYLVALLEGILFYFSIVPRRWWKIKPYLPVPDRHYLMWRLGTLYGIYPNHKLNEPPNSYGRLLWMAWQDRKQVILFLLWRRDMRRRTKRATHLQSYKK